MKSISSISIIACVFASGLVAVAQTVVHEEAASSSLLANTPVTLPANADPTMAPHALRSVSLFAVAPPEPRTYKLHDLVQVIVRETSKATSSQELETDKETKLEGSVPRWPNLNLEDLARLTLKQSDDTDNPALSLDFTKEFKGEGDYERKDDLSARLTAEVIEVLPNGNLILEARTHIKTDEEEATMKVTGICRPADITPANTILSNQIHDLMVEKVHKGELRRSSEKGIIAKVLETVFAF